MVTNRDLFGNARIKLVRANQHITQFQAARERFLQSDFAEVVVKNDPYGAEYVLEAKATGPVPADLLLIAGDAIHNLRCALDYTLTELLGRENSTLSFPFHETREELERTFSADGADPCATCGRGGKKGSHHRVEMAVAGISRIILDEIRPYKAANGFLWPLGKLDNRDKHRLLLAVVVPLSIRDVRFRDSNYNQVSIADLSFAHGQIERLLRHCGMAELESYGEMTAEIFFNEPGVVEGQAVLPTLVNMAQAVAQTIDRIEEFALAAGWTPAAN